MDEAEHCNRIGLMHGGKLVALGTPEELKRATISGIVLEIEGAPQNIAQTVVKQHPGIHDVAPHGARLHAIVDDAATIPALRAALLEAGVGELRIETVAPSLEDVFVTLVGNNS
jgi:ABC-2 type transport system ATP-binding protein